MPPWQAAHRRWRRQRASRWGHVARMARRRDARMGSLLVCKWLVHLVIILVLKKWAAELLLSLLSNCFGGGSKLSHIDMVISLHWKLKNINNTISAFWNIFSCVPSRNNIKNIFSKFVPKSFFKYMELKFTIVSTCSFLLTHWVADEPWMHHDDLITPYSPELKSTSSQLCKTYWIESELGVIQKLQLSYL